MNRVWKLRRAAIPVALVILAVGAAFGGSPSARAAPAPAVAAVTSLRMPGLIEGIAATSAANAWAVGATGMANDASARMVILHWNGASWSRVKNFEAYGQVSSISMDSPADAWAIAAPPGGPTFVIHWNGRAWSRVTIPHENASLTAIVAVGGDVWVSATPATHYVQLMLHRTGGRWYVVPVPSPPYFGSFAALSRGSIWAAGSDLVRWNGTMWKKTAEPRGETLSFVSGVPSGPVSSVWAVGGPTGEAGVTYGWHWTGRAWIRSIIAAASQADSVSAIAAIPGGTAWVVGSSDLLSMTKHPALIAHWSGRAWTMMNTPAQAQPSDNLLAVAATSPKDAWAVGDSTCVQEHCPVITTLILHWNGKAWS